MFQRISNAAFAVVMTFALFGLGASSSAFAARDGGGGTSRSCLTGSAQALLGRIEARFGSMRLVSTCRPGATIAGSGRVSKHASGNAIDFEAGGRKGEVVAWLVANHHSGGTMTYGDSSHIHVDIGPHFVSLAGGQRYASNNSGSSRSRAKVQNNDSDDSSSNTRSGQRRSQTRTASADDDSGSSRSRRRQPMEGYMGLGGRNPFEIR